MRKGFKNLFKISILLLLVLMTFSFASCKNGNENDPGNNTGQIEEEKYGNVSLASIENGQARLSLEGRLVVGTKVTIDPRANEGYELDQVLLNDKALDKLEFEVIEGENVIKITFKLINNVSPVDEDREIHVTSENFNKLSFLELVDVKENLTYPNEFTVTKGTGTITSSFEGASIYKIELISYGKYENLELYDTKDLEHKIESTVEDCEKYKSSKLYTYILDNASGFKVINPSTYDVYLFEINIYYKGSFNPEMPFIEKDGEIEISANSLNKHSKYTSDGVTIDSDKKLVFAPNSYVTGLELENVTLIEMYEGSTSLSVYGLTSDGIEVKIEYTNSSTSASINYELVDEFDGFLIKNETNEEIKVTGFIVYYKAVDKIIDISIPDAVSAALALSRNRGLSELTYRLSGVISLVDGSQVTIRDENDNTIVAYMATRPESMNLGFRVTLVGKLQNYYGKAEIVEYVVEAFDEVSYTITLTDSVNGSYSVNKTEDISYSDMVIVTATPDEGYVAKYCLVAGIRHVFRDNVSKFQINQSGEIKVVFEEYKEVDPTLGEETFYIYSLEMCGTYGDANLVKYGDYDILVDAGTNDDTQNLKMLLNTYVTDGILDLIIVSHPDSDHYSGIVNGALAGVDEVKRLIVNNNHSENDKIKNAVLTKSSDAVIELASNLTSAENLIYTIQVDDLFSIDIMYNSYYLTTSKNNASIPAIINFKNTKVFMAGDMEDSSCDEFMQRYPDMFSEEDYVIFKVLHHGSKGTNSARFLEYLKPDFAFVSAPLKTTSSNNTPSFSNHPYFEAMIRVGAVTTDVYWAGICGTLTIECDGEYAVAEGAGRTRDYYYYDAKTQTYVMADREEEIDIYYFESKWYLEAIRDINAPDYMCILDQ